MYRRITDVPLYFGIEIDFSSEQVHRLAVSSANSKFRSTTTPRAYTGHLRYNLTENLLTR